MIRRSLRLRWLVLTCAGAWVFACSSDRRLGGPGIAGSGAAAGTAGSGGSATSGSSGKGGSSGNTTAGDGAGGGNDTGGTSGNGSGGTLGSTGGSGATSGSAGTTGCDCSYGDLTPSCCVQVEACEPDEHSCEELRQSIAGLRTYVSGNDADTDDEERCIERIHDELLERCAFVQASCDEPAEAYATFGDHGDEGYSECTELETSALLRCGEPGSYYAPDCCQRRRCKADADCEDGGCIQREVQSSEFNPGAPHADSCSITSRGCQCGFIEAGETGAGYCIGNDEDVARYHCAVASRSCEYLEAWSLIIQEATTDIATLQLDVPAAQQAQYDACQAKIAQELERRCGASGAGGAGGAGTSDAGAGGFEASAR